MQGELHQWYRVAHVPPGHWDHVARQDGPFPDDAATRNGTERGQDPPPWVSLQKAYVCGHTVDISARGGIPGNRGWASRAFHLRVRRAVRV